MADEIKSAFTLFQDDEIVVITKSLHSGFLNITHHGTGLKKANIKTVDELEKARANAELSQNAYFESEEGKKFITFQKENDIQKFDSLSDVGELAEFGDKCYEDSEDFLKSLS